VQLFFPQGQEENVPAEDIKLLTLLSEQLRSELECNLDHFTPVCEKHKIATTAFDQTG